MHNFAMNTAHAIYANTTVSMTDLRRNPSGILEEAGDAPIAVLNHNRPAAYLVPAPYFERLMQHLEDLEDAKLARERANGPFVEVNPQDL